VSLPLRLLPEAKSEFDDAADWYEGRKAGLGVEFIAEIRKTLTMIASLPRIHAVVHGKARKATVRRFPYIVVYREEPDEIVVIAVFHTSRDPSVWKDRI
jgi:toxin ParE1/3/4